MVAHEFEYRHRFWIIVLVYALAYACYNLDHLNILYAVVPRNLSISQKDLIVRLLYAAATLLAAAGAALLTWATAYRSPSTSPNRATLTIAGPFRYVRNPHYLAYFFLLVALATFQSRLGSPIMLLAEAILLLRLVAREEFQLEQEYGERFRVYRQRVPRLLPSFRPRVEKGSELPRWGYALWNHVFQWGCVATLLAFACTLSDSVGYAFAAAAIAFILVQKLAHLFWIRLQRA
jgi:protein-S-isoprenylcysteine O-methyltransferase Ste14